MNNASTFLDHISGNTLQPYRQYYDALAAWRGLLSPKASASLAHDDTSLLALTDTVLRELIEHGTALHSSVHPVKKVELIGEQVARLASLLPILLICQLHTKEKLSEINKAILTR